MRSPTLLKVAFILNVSGRSNGGIADWEYRSYRPSLYNKGYNPS